MGLVCVCEPSFFLFLVDKVLVVPAWVVNILFKESSVLLSLSLYVMVLLSSERRGLFVVIVEGRLCGRVSVTRKPSSSSMSLHVGSREH